MHNLPLFEASLPLPLSLPRFGLLGLELLGKWTNQRKTRGAPLPLMPLMPPVTGLPLFGVPLSLPPPSGPGLDFGAWGISPGLGIELGAKRTWSLQLPLPLTGLAFGAHSSPN